MSDPATILDTEVLIIGSGAGGATTAAQLAEAGRTVTVVEEGPWVEPDAVFRHAAPQTVGSDVDASEGATGAAVHAHVSQRLPDDEEALFAYLRRRPSLAVDFTYGAVML